MILFINGIEIKVRRASLSDNPVGEIVQPAFSGMRRSSVRARKRSWNIETIDYEPNDATVIHGLLRESPPFSCTGILVGGGPVPSLVEVDNEDSEVPAVGGFLTQFNFTLHEI